MTLPIDEMLADCKLADECQNETPLLRDMSCHVKALIAENQRLQDIQLSHERAIRMLNEELCHGPPDTGVCQK